MLRKILIFIISWVLLIPVFDIITRIEASVHFSVMLIFLFSGLMWGLPISIIIIDGMIKDRHKKARKNVSANAYKCGEPRIIYTEDTFISSEIIEF